MDPCVYWTVRFGRILRCFDLDQHLAPASRDQLLRFGSRLLELDVGIGGQIGIPAFFRVSHPFV